VLGIVHSKYNADGTASFMNIAPLEAKDGNGKSLAYAALQLSLE
jgi:hypothetical protein